MRYKQKSGNISEGIIQAFLFLFILASFLGSSSIGGLLLQFALGMFQLMSALIQSDKSPVRRKYLAIALSYVAFLLILLFTQFSSYPFVPFVIVVPLCIGLWYIVLTLREGFGYFAEGESAADLDTDILDLSDNDIIEAVAKRQRERIKNKL